MRYHSELYRRYSSVFLDFAMGYAIMETLIGGLVIAITKPDKMSGVRPVLIRHFYILEGL